MLTHRDVLSALVLCHVPCHSLSFHCIVSLSCSLHGNAEVQILFKFALDEHGIYGGDEGAQKGASHDLKGLVAYHMAQVPGLHFPLMAVIHYLGHSFCHSYFSTSPIKFEHDYGILPHLVRSYHDNGSIGHCLVAVSLLPLEKGSLRYGSSDGGKTVHADDPQLNEVPIQSIFSSTTLPSKRNKECMTDSESGLQLRLQFDFDSF